MTDTPTHPAVPAAGPSIEALTDQAGPVFRAEMGHYSSVVGNSVHLIASEGHFAGQVMIIGQDDRLREKGTQLRLLQVIHDALNRRADLAAPSAPDHVAAAGKMAPSAPAEGIDARAVAEAVENAEGAGNWLSCTGCHELDEGYPTGRYSAALKCYLGLGCTECGGLGAVWDTTDYAEMGDWLAKELVADVDREAPSAPAEVEGLVERLRNAAITIGMCDDGDGRDAVVDAATALTAQQAEIERLRADRRLIIDERDRTFALVFARAEKAEAKLAAWKADAEALAKAGQAVPDNADRPGSRMGLNIGPDGEDIWIDHQEVEQTELDGLSIALARLDQRGEGV